MKVNLTASIENGLDNEAQWLFWVLMKRKEKLRSEEIAGLFNRTQDDILRIMLIDYSYKRGKIHTKKVKERLDELLSSLDGYSLGSERWLLIYEWIFHKWPGYKTLEDKLNKYDFFKALRNKKVNFYKSEE